MLVKTDSPPVLAKKALTRTIIALETAGDLDTRYSKEDKTFLAEQRAALILKRNELGGAIDALNTFDEDEGLRLQTRVEVGDAVLDDGAADGKAKTKAGLRGKTGLNADHAFGTNIQKLQDIPIPLEPDEILKVAARMSDLPAFLERETIQANLITLANQQKINLANRTMGELTRTKLVSATTNKTLEGVRLLLSVKGLLDARFPGQKKRVESFFLDIGRAPKAKLDPRAEAIFAVLAAHAVTVTAEDEAKITAETNPETLERWLQRSINAKDTQELFVESQPLVR